MTGLRLEVDLDKIGHNARSLVDWAAASGISVTAVTKATLGDPVIARVLSSSGVVALADSRVENIERMRSARIVDPMWLIRSPAPSQVERVVQTGATSFNSESAVLAALSDAADGVGRVHGVVVMVELGDLRDGVMPAQLHETIVDVLRRPGLCLRGIGANLACRNGIEPSDANMGELSDLADSVEDRFGVELETVSGGNSANLAWLQDGGSARRVNNLRLGESILLGRDPLTSRPIPGLHADAIVLVAEVIESKRKPSKPWGHASRNAFGELSDVGDRGEIWQTILAAGRQDVASGDLVAPPGVTILGMSSDHLVAETGSQMAAGDELRFAPGYAALLRSMTSPFVQQRLATGEAHRSRTSPIDGAGGEATSTAPNRPGPALSLVPSLPPDAALS